MGMILAFAGSNSSTSINFKLLEYTTSLVKDHSVQVLNMATTPFPMYSEDAEKENGFSEALRMLKNHIQNSDGVLISVNEHNGYPSAYFKNLIDWMSRLDRKFIDGKKLLLMATSPGGRGGIGALEAAEKMLSRFGASPVITFSLPSFHQNFKEGEGIIDAIHAVDHKKALSDFLVTI